MARPALRDSSEARRTALRRVATAGSLAVLLLAIYEAWPRRASCPQPANPKAGVGYACDRLGRPTTTRRSGSSSPPCRWPPWSRRVGF